jgi:tRNA (guanine-N7-)-methyltransferase
VREAGEKLYGRRKGKTLREHQGQLVATLLPKLTLDVAAPIVEARALFSPAVTTLWLEIGFGGGEHMIGAARRAPTTGFIGCEPFVNGVAKALAGIEADGLANVRLFNGDAALVIDALPAQTLDGVYLLYPDPWPKRRQRKRRFLSDAMLSRLARVMRPGAELRFATDIDDNAGWTLARILRAADFDWTAATAADWNRPWPEWAGTRYEAKAIAAGRPPVYLTFRRR